MEAGSAAAKDNIQAPAPAMATVRRSHCSDARGMPGYAQPVVNGSPNPTANEWRIPLAFMAGYQQQHPFAGSNRLLQRSVDRFPGPVEAVAMEVENPVGIDPASADAPVPAAVQRRLMMRPRPLGGCWLSWRRFYWSSCSGASDDRLDCRQRRCFRWISRQRADGRGNPRPQRCFFRGQAAHVSLRPSAEGSTQRPWQPCPRRSGGPTPLPPRRYRTGWRP